MNAVIYARYSSYAQGEQSIEGQLHDCRAFASRENLTVTREYIDRALTGRTDSRPCFHEMIADARQRTFERVIVWKFDRFARNTYDSVLHKHTLNLCGVRVVSVTEPIPENPAGKMLESVLDALAEYYSDGLRENVQRGIRESMARGTYLGGSVPFGYKVIDKRLVVNEEQADVVRYIYEEYANGATRRQILDELARRGIRIGRSPSPSPAVFNNLLKNRKYIGEYIYNGCLIENGCPPILSVELFERVQQRIALRRVYTTSAASAPYPYILQGKVFCGICGEPLNSDCGRGRQGGMYYYYSCKNRKKAHACLKKLEQKERLELQVLDQVRNYLLVPECRDRIVNIVMDECKKGCAPRSVKSIENRILSLEGQINECINLSISPDMTRDMRLRYVRRAGELSVRKQDLGAERTTLKNMIASNITHARIAELLDALCDGASSDKTQLKNIIDLFVSSVYVRDDSLEIYFNFKNGAQTSSLFEANMRNGKQS